MTRTTWPHSTTQTDRQTSAGCLLQSLKMVTSTPCQFPQSGRVASQLRYLRWQNPPPLDQLLPEVSEWQCKYIPSPIWHTASASWKNQLQTLAKPNCSKTYIKRLQLNQIPMEAESSARDPSTGSSPYWIHYIFFFFWVPRPAFKNCFLLPWHYPCVPPTETSLDKQKYPKMTRRHRGGRGEQEQVDFLNAVIISTLHALNFPQACAEAFWFPHLLTRHCVLWGKENGRFTFGLWKRIKVSA